MASIYVEVNMTQEDQPGVASVSGDSPVSSSGGANPVISLEYVPVNQAGDTMSGSLTATVTYTPASAGKWNGSPTNLKDAVDRIAAVVGLTVPIP